MASVTQMTGVRQLPGIRWLSGCSVIARIVGAALIGVPFAHVAHADTLEITFPPGWAVTVLPAPSLGGWTVAGGQRRRAVLSAEDGRPLAIIELTTLPWAVDRLPDLPVLMQGAEETAATGFRKAGLDDVCDAPIRLTMGERDALQTSCMIRHAGKSFLQQVLDEPVLRQALVVWKTPDAVRSLTYTAPPGVFENDIGFFEQTLASVRAE